MNKVFYFKNTICSVCNDLLPKVQSHFATHYPKLQFEIIDIQESPEVAGQNGVFTVPVLVVFLEGKEQFRLVRNFSLPEIDANLNRVYGLMFQ